MKRTTDLDTASELLGISKDAIRKRIERGTIKAERDSKGRWQVVLEDDIRTDRPDTDGHLVQVLERHIDVLEKQIEVLNRQVEDANKGRERSDFLFMLERQKVLQLEAPKKKESWFRRFFFGESKDSNNSI